MSDEVKKYITPGGFRRLQEELARLWKVERPPLVATVAWASSVRLFDPLAYLASLLCIVTACACAALIPALRAGRIDPVVALRQD